MTKDALAITQAAIEAVNPSKAIRSHLSYAASNEIHLLNRSTGQTLTYNVLDYDEIYIAAFGKAASSMALSTAQILSDTKLPIRGMVITKDDHATREQMDYLSSYNVELHYAAHPIPDERSIAHSNTLLSQLAAVNEKTLVVNCISGGGSSLFCAPRDPLNLTHMSKFNQQLLACGMPITEMNVLRKKLEVGKGGGVVQVASPATCITMVLSDVIGDPLDLIASGPTVKDGSTWTQAWNLVQRYGLGKGAKYELPGEILDILKTGSDKDNQDNGGDEDEERDDWFKMSETVLVGNNALAVSAAAEEAKRLGYNPVILGTTIEGEAVHIANMYVSLAQQIQLQRTNPALASFPIANLPAALIVGGETTVSLTENSGKGGRNQEIGLAAGLGLRACKLRDIVLASIGTDGTDGPTDAAGAVVDGGTIDRVEFDNGFVYKGEEALRNHDAYTFFDGSKQGKPLVKTGATGTNVADVCVVLIK